MSKTSINTASVASIWEHRNETILADGCEDDVAIIEAKSGIDQTSGKVNAIDRVGCIHFRTFDLGKGTDSFIFSPLYGLKNWVDGSFLG